MVKTNLTNKSIKNNNRYNMLRALVEHKALQRSQLTDISKVSTITVKKNVDELLAAGILKETLVSSSIGRKPKELSFVDDLGCFCCINLSKTSQIGYFIYDIHSKDLYDGISKVSAPQNFLKTLKECFADIKNVVDSRLGLQLLGIAVSVPSVYYEKIDAVNCDLIPGLKDVHLKKLIGNTFSIGNINIIHDVFANATLEYQLSDKGGLYYFYVGDGLGSAFIRNGEVFRGDAYVAGEIGRCLTFSSMGEELYEDILSTRGLSRRLGIVGNGQLEELIHDYPALSLEQKEAIDDTVEFATTLLYNICWTINPATIIVDSSIPSLAKLIHESLKKKTERFASSPIKNQVNVSLPKEQNHYAMKGCIALLVNDWIEEILKTPKL